VIVALIDLPSLPSLSQGVDSIASTGVAVRMYCCELIMEEKRGPKSATWTLSCATDAWVAFRHPG